MPKVSGLPQDNSPTTADYVVGDQASGPTTQRFTFSSLITLFWTLANIPTGATSPITRDGEQELPGVASGMVWSGVSYGVSLNGNMSSGICYINGRRISIAAVSAHAFTASKDTYVDILDNGDGTGTIVYTAVTNGAAAPALAANSIRIAKVVTGAGSIAAATSIVQWGSDTTNPIYPSEPFPFNIFQLGLTNAGTAAGTANYIKFGGLKLMWGITGSISLTSQSQVTATLTWPAAFNSAPTLLVSGTPGGTISLQAHVNTTPTTSGATLAIDSTTGSAQTGSMVVHWLAIGV